MTNTETRPGKVIQNVAVLDLRTTTPETLAGIARIQNAALVIFSPATAPLVAQLSVGNLSAVVQASPEAQVISGQQRINHDGLISLKQPLDMIIEGELIIEADVQPEDIERSLGALIVSGIIRCPHHLVGALQPKIRHLDGEILTEEEGKIQVGILALTESYLQALEDGTALRLVGNLLATTVLPNDLLARKIGKIVMQGRIICCAENEATLLKVIDPASQVGRATVIPAGYSYFDKPLLLDAIRLTSLPGKKLYCTTLQLADDIEPAMLDNAIEALKVSDLLIAPVALKTTLAQKCNLLEPKLIFYEGELWLIERETKLLADRFTFLNGKATVVVQSELTLAPDVEPKVLADRLVKVHNRGSIICTPAQMAALQARLGLDEGEFGDGTKTKHENGENVIGNAAYLKL